MKEAKEKNAANPGGIQIVKAVYKAPDSGKKKNLV